MSEAAADASRFGDPYMLGRGHGGGGDEATGHGLGGPASRRIIVAYGFWIFLLSDIVIFSGFFAAFAVLSGRTDGGPGAADIIELPRAAAQTALLLLSTFTAGLVALAAERRDRARTLQWLAVTGALGAAFLFLEATEFAALVSEGSGPQRSAFLSAFFALVGCHGVHVTIALIWLATLAAQISAKGFQPIVLRKIACFNLFWHALDIVWVAILTIVYLMGYGG